MGQEVKIKVEEQGELPQGTSTQETELEGTRPRTKSSERKMSLIKEHEKKAKESPQGDHKRRIKIDLERLRRRPKSVNL